MKPLREMLSKAWCVLCPPPLCRSGSPCLSNRSSPLSAPRSPGPDANASAEPFSDGADIQVSNLDYRMSRKELQQILQDTFAKHGKVRAQYSGVNSLRVGCL